MQVTMEYDPDFQRATARTFESLGFPPNRPIIRLSKGDIKSRRQGAIFIKAVLGLDQQQYPDIERTDYKIPGFERGEISIIAYRKTKRQPLLPEPAVLYMHGGGMIFGSAELFEPMTKADVSATGVAHFSIDYRLAPAFRHPTPVEDCYAGLKWLSTHAKELGIDSTRIAVAGLSAGGGLAAGVALLARDRGFSPPISKQILFCPMLDDKNTTTNPDLLPRMTWAWDDNWTGWNALLGDIMGSDSVSQYAAPARAKDVTNLPPTYIDVGSLDIFAEESKTYADRLSAAGVQVEWHLYKGVPHGFEFRGVGSQILKQALSNRHATIRSLTSNQVIRAKV